MSTKIKLLAIVLFFIIAGLTLTQSASEKATKTKTILKLACVPGNKISVTVVTGGLYDKTIVECSGDITETDES